MIKKFHKGESENYEKWEHFKVIKKFTFLPLRLYQYTSQTTWWSWLSTTYILQSWVIGGDGILNSIKHYFNGGYWRNERISDVEEYNDYIDYVNSKK